MKRRKTINKIIAIMKIVSTRYVAIKCDSNENKIGNKIIVKIVHLKK